MKKRGKVVRYQAHVQCRKFPTLDGTMPTASL